MLKPFDKVLIKRVKKPGIVDRRKGKLYLVVFDNHCSMDWFTEEELEKIEDE